MKVGEWRWVAGQGVMRIEELADPPKKISVTCRRPGGYTYWAGVDQVRGLVNKKDLDFHRSELETRSLSTEGFEVIEEWLRSQR